MLKKREHVLKQFSKRSTVITFYFVDEIFSSAQELMEIKESMFKIFHMCAKVQVTNKDALPDQRRVHFCNLLRSSSNLKSRNLVPVWYLFRFAKILDILMIVVGTVMSLVSGLANPLNMLLLGSIIDYFISHDVASQLKSSISDNCTSLQSIFNDDANISSNFTLIGPQGGYFCDQGSRGDSNIFRYVTSCDLDHLLQSDIAVFSYYYLGMAVGLLISACLGVSLWNWAAYRQGYRMRIAFFKSIMEQDIGWFDMNSSGGLNTRLSDDIEKIQAGIGDKAAVFLIYFSSFVAGFVIAFTTHWKMSLVVCTLLPLLVFISGMLAKIVATFTVKEQSAYASAGSVAEETLSSVRTVVAFGGEQEEVDRYASHLGNAKRVGYVKGILTALVTGLLYFVMFGGFALAFWYGATLVTTCDIIPGDVITVFFGIVVGSFSLGNALPEIQTFATALGSATAVFAVIDRVPLIDATSDEGDTIDNLKGDIRFNNVCFTYPARSNVQVLHGLDLEVRVGQTVALVGPSGCGKSTVIQLLQRFYNPDAGQIFVDGRDISQLNLKWLRENIGVVSQEPVLFNTTIRENIKYGKKNIEEEEMVAAIKAANAYKFISELPDGLDTYVGQKGIQLSGGQKQRIAIARALVRDPKILLLDEATSALDTESEKVVQEALDKAREGRTTIVIAHRLSTIQSAEVITGIKDGRVVEMGTHSELMDKRGLYYDLVTTQINDKESGMAIQTAGSLTVIERQSYEETEITMDSSTSTVHFNSKSASKNLKDESLLEEIKDQSDPLVKVTTKELFSLNKPDWYLVITGVAGMGILGALFPMMSVLFSGILQSFSNLDKDDLLDEVEAFAGYFMLLAVGAGSIQFIGVATLSIAGERLTQRLRIRTFSTMLRQEISWFDRKSHSTGALTSQLAVDTSDVKGATGLRLGVILQTIAGIITALIIAMEASWILTLVLFCLFPIYTATALIKIKLLGGRSKRNKELGAESAKTANEAIDNIRTVAALGLEREFLELYQNQLLPTFKLNMKNVFLQGLLYATAQPAIFIVNSGGFSLGAFLVTQDPSSVIHTTYSRLFRVFAALAFTAISVGRTASFTPDAQKAQVSASRILTLLRRKPEIDGYDKGGLKPEKRSGIICLKNIDFTYPSRPHVPVLQGFNIVVHPGETMALVGPSGCGKSTVVSLVERFYDVVAGSVEVDGYDIRDLNIGWLRSQIGIVSQEPVLFDRSIADNIRYGANVRNVSDEDVVEAAKAANIHSFIESLPEGFNTNVGSKGTQLSGGQKQRIAIARALVRDPKILLLDEATSALDTESEKVVQETLDKAREGRTCIVIAHRLSTIYNSDCICVINNGSVLERGTHSELMEVGGAYYLLNTVTKDKNNL